MTNPLSDEDYERQMDKLQAMAAADSEPVETSDEEMQKLRERFGSDE